MPVFVRRLMAASSLCVLGVLGVLALAGPAQAQLRGATPEEMKFNEMVKRMNDPFDKTAPGPNTNGARADEERKKYEKVAPKLSPPVAKELVSAQKLVGEMKYAEALVAATKALEVSKTDYERLKSYQFVMVINNNLGNTAAATTAAETAAELPGIPDEDKKDAFISGIAMATKSGHTDKAVAYAKKMIAANMDDPKSTLVISQTLYNGGDNEGARAFAQKQVDAAFARGERPSREWIEIVLATHIRANDKAGAQRALEMRALLYNDASDWEKLANVTLAQNGVREADVVYLGRLLLASGAKVSKDNADLYGGSAVLLTYYGDATNAASKGGSGFITSQQRLNEDRNTLDQQIALGARSGGAYNAKLAHVLYGYGKYAEAEGAARTALQKGGDPDASEAPMALGMALVAEGKYTEADAVFSKVSGGGPVTPRVAQLWASLAKAKGAPYASAPQPAAH